MNRVAEIVGGQVNRLIKCSELTDGRSEIIWYVKDQVRRRITSPKAAEYYGILLENIRNVTKEEFYALDIGGDLYAPPVNYEDAMDFMEARAFIYSRLQGNGIEVGAACLPSPAPLLADVKFADKFADDEGCKAVKEFYGGIKEWVKIDYFTSVDDLCGIRDHSLDFIIHNHVLEHSKNLFGALDSAHKKLSGGGICAFALPDKNYTFDKGRKLTTVKHLAMDYHHPLLLRDFIHYAEWIVKGRHYNYLTPGELIGFFFDKLDVHWHVFDPESFEQILQEYARISEYRWKEMRVYGTLKKNSAMEFYVVLEK